MTKSNKYHYKKIRVAIEKLLIDDSLFTASKEGSPAAFKIYNEEFKRYRYLELPLCLRQLNSTKYNVLSHIHEVEVAIQNGLKEMEIVEITGLHPEESLRLMIHRATFIDMNYLDRYYSFKLLKEHLTESTFGKKWANEIPGNKTILKMAKITGYSASYIHIILYIGDDEKGLSKLKELQYKDQGKEGGALRKLYDDVQYYKLIKSVKAGINSNTDTDSTVEFIKPKNLRKLKANTFSTKNGTVINSDCLGDEGMCLLESQSIDMALVDLPYGLLNKKWDTPIDLQLFWKNLKRVVKPGGVMVLFGTKMFTAKLMLSNEEDFKQKLVWDKGNVSNYVNSKIEHLQCEEDILIFSEGKANFYPQGLEAIPPEKQKQKKPRANGNKLKHVTGNASHKQLYTGFPQSIIRGFPSEKGSFHDTPKPVGLYEYIIKSYSKKGGTIIDCCLGSGTTCIAAANTDRNFIGFEMDFNYFDNIRRRIYKEIKRSNGKPYDSCCVSNTLLRFYKPYERILSIKEPIKKAA